MEISTARNLMTDLCSSMEHSVWLDTILGSLKEIFFQDGNDFGNKTNPTKQNLHLLKKYSEKEIFCLYLLNDSCIKKEMRI